MSTFVATIMIDCNDLEGMVAFWKQALNLEEGLRYPDYVWLSSVGENGPALAFQRVPEPRVGKNRIHLDMISEDPAAFVEKIVGLGGSKVEDRGTSDFRWTVLADPEGNEFCVTAVH